MKLAAKKSNILYPEYLITNNIFEIDNLKLKYPLIVKHHNSYSSIGLTEDSVVYDIESLKKQAKYMISKYNKILIEEFIEGREFTVLVVSIDKNNVFAFDAAEIIFPAGEYFKHFNLKWKNHNSMKYIKVDDNSLNEYLKQSSIKIYKNINGNGYARFDYRMNKNGDIFFLELNPNCSIYYPENDLSSADEILNFYENGHQFFTDAILNFALQRFI
jgi:D-alanine-D-alanine ligase